MSLKLLLDTSPDNRLRVTFKNGEVVEGRPAPTKPQSGALRTLSILETTLGGLVYYTIENVASVEPLT